jgi:Holliday junction resolvasome RuvABC endonuclease subunit
MKILALDMSSTTIGVCYNGRPEPTILLKGPDIAARCLQAAAAIRPLIDGADVDLVAIESPYLNYQRPASVIPLARVSGAVLALISGFGVAWYEFAPSTGKKALTGKGVATKGQMIAAAVAALGEQVDEHAADAYGLWRAACALRVEVVV